jgi:hypothetical protein
MLDKEYRISPYEYKYYPKTNKLLGKAIMYKDNTYYVKLFTVDVEGHNVVEVPIVYNEQVWNYYLSPDEKYIAYECKDKICIEELISHQVEIIGQTVINEEGISKKQTLIGWMNKY